MDRPRGLSYARARLFVLLAGLGILVLLAALLYVRRVDTVEVAATLLFIPVFVAFVFGGVLGGVVAGALSGLGYVALRYPAIEVLGFGSLFGVIASRFVAFVAFGGIGGWANRQLESSLTKLELYDQIDDATGLYNARFFVQDTDLEVSRSQRYQTLFSITAVDFPAEALDRLGGRQRKATLRELGRLLRESVRTVDRAIHARTGDRHRIAVVLPETGTEGARIFSERLADRLHEFLEGRGARLDRAAVGQIAFTYPDEEDRLTTMREEFAAIERAEHPEATQSPS
ncbi:MAG: diguanylate cyclase [Actinomycetota bacterium]